MRTEARPNALTVLAIFDEDMRENDFYIFVPSDLDRWPLARKSAALVTFVQRYISGFPIGSTGRTDRRTEEQTNGVQRLMLLPREGRIISGLHLGLDWYTLVYTSLDSAIYM